MQVTPENDPRDLDDMESESDGSDSQDYAPLRHADDSDPDEADIEEHMGPHGFRYRQSTRHGTGQRHADPGIEPVMESFYDMVQNFGHPRQFPPGNFASGQNQTFGGPRIQRTTFTSGTFGGGTTSFTIISGPGTGRRQEGAANGTADPFQA